jgi:hypothetical protein
LKLGTQAPGYRIFGCPSFSAFFKKKQSRSFLPFSMEHPHHPEHCMDGFAFNSEEVKKEGFFVTSLPKKWQKHRVVQDFF